MRAMGDFLVGEHSVCSGHNVVLSSGVLIQSVMLRFKPRVHDGHGDCFVAGVIAQSFGGIDCRNVPVPNAV